MYFPNNNSELAGIVKDSKSDILTKPYYLESVPLEEFCSELSR